MAKALANSIRAELNTKAYFVAGAEAWFRDSSDVVAESAILDAEQLLAAIGDEIEDPSISAGTTNHPQNIISLSWHFFNHRPYKFIYISCKGNGKFDVNLDMPDGSHNKFESVALSEILDLDIPQIAKALKTNESPDCEPHPTNDSH